MLRIAIAAAGLVSMMAAAHADTIVINVGGLDKQIYLPARLAETLGYYKDEGLDVELDGEAAGVEGADALIAGEAQGVVGFYDHTIDLASKGKHAESIVQFSRAPGEVELVSTRIADSVKDFADLKGKSLGVTGLGSSTNFLTQYMAVRSGLAVSDVTSIAVGAGGTFLAAMKQGAIDGGMTTEPTVSRAVNTGLAKVFIDMRTVDGTRAALGGTYPAACLYMATAYVEKHPDITQKLANVYVRTLRFIATHSGAEIAAKMPADYYAGDKDAYIKALDAGKGMFTADGVMPEDGPPTVLKVLSTFSPALKGKTVDVTTTYTTEFVKKVPPLAMSVAPAVRLAGVARRFATADGGLISALEEFDLDIAPGEFCAIVGPTGCGKSTTLGLVAGLARPQAGVVELFGKSVASVDRRVGFVFQQDALFPWRRVLDNVMAGPEFRGEAHAAAERRARDWLGRVHLGAFERAYPHQLSGGMRKRVALAQTFINAPEVLLMDEPFSALDVQTREMMQEELLGLWSEQRAAVLFVTHDLDEAILLADRVAVLTARPARVKSLHVIDIPRPRSVAELRYDSRFIAIAKRLAEDLREEVLRARAVLPALA